MPHVDAAAVWVSFAGDNRDLAHLTRCSDCRERFFEVVRAAEAFAIEEEATAEGVATDPRDAIWQRLGAQWQKTAGAVERERHRAAALWSELSGLAETEQLARVEREDRFWSLWLAMHLNEASRGAAESSPARSEHLARLSDAIAGRLSERDFPAMLVAEARARAESLLGTARRLQADPAGAERHFEAAARHLESLPLDSSERAFLCHSLALLRQHRSRTRPEDALGLLERAACLYEHLEQFDALGEVLTDRGWLCHDEGDPEVALRSFQTAVTLLDSAKNPRTALRALYGRALCHADLGSGREAVRSLAGARELAALLADPRDRLQFARLEAKVDETTGQLLRAVATLERVLRALVADEAYYEAALSALALARLYVRQGRVEAVVELRHELAPLITHGALPQRARAVFLFALQFATRRDRDTSEVLIESEEYLERARNHREPPFRPCREALAEMSWNELDADFRCKLCEEAGVPQAVAKLKATEVDPALRDLITWTYQELVAVRIVFEPAPPAGNGAG